MSPEPSAAASLPPLPSGDGARCKICGGTCAPFGEVSFLRACGRPDPAPGGGAPKVRYQRCTECGLLFTAAFDAWSGEDFQAHVYNDAYLELDPDYVEKRPMGTARMLIGAFGHARGEIRALDYGGGNGLVARELRDAAFACETYDPFSTEHRAPPAGRFNLISCIEMVEHLPHPMETLADLVRFADESALILFTTLLQPDDILQQGMGWWYIGPRNGHLTMHTPRSLSLMWARLGFACASLSPGAHVAFRNPPPFALPLLMRAGGAAA